MSQILNKTCSLGGSKTGLVGSLGVAVLNSNGSVNIARSTASIIEIGGGTYNKEITFDDDFQGSVVWDSGEATPVYAVEDINLSSDISDIKDMKFNKSILTKVDDSNYTEDVYESDGTTIKQTFNIVKSGVTESRLPV